MNQKPEETPPNPEPLDIDFESIEPTPPGETEAFEIPPEAGVPATGSGLGPEAFAETPAPLGDLEDHAVPPDEVPEGDDLSSDAFAGDALTGGAMPSDEAVGEAEGPTGRKGRTKKARKAKARKEEEEEGGSALASFGAKLQAVTPYTWMLLFSLIAILIATGLLVGELAAYKYDMKAKEMRSGITAPR